MNSPRELTHPAAPGCTRLLHPAGRHPERLGLDAARRAQQLRHGRRQVVVDEGLVEQVAVVKLEPRGRVEHVTQLVVLPGGGGRGGTDGEHRQTRQMARQIT